MRMLESELEKKIKELEKLNSFKSDVISISAHELRTSLTALKWINEMLINGDVGPLLLEQKQFIQKSNRSIERMLLLVKEMLTINHTETIGLSYFFTKVDIVSLIEEVVFDFVGESYKKSIQTVFIRPENYIPKIKADPDKIRVVLQNLIENAIKYSKTNDKVIISVYKKENFVWIYIKDNGIGIPQNEKKKIFSKFYRGKYAKKGHPFGSGLGLYTAKKIINAHNGEIDFESKKNEGTTFFFSLPIA